MTKEDFYSLFIYLSMAAVILVVGFGVVRPAMETGYLAVTAGANFGFLLISLIIGVLINVLFIEVGHLLGAKIGGYKIFSTNILGFNIYKKEVEDGKYKTTFRMKSFDGFTGETKITPKSEKSNPMPYVFTPLFLMLLEFVGLYLVLTLIKDSKEDSQSLYMFVKYGMIIVSAIGGCFIIYDYFPARLDSLNDGYRCVLLNKKINIDAYNTQLTYEEAEFYNKTIENYKVYTEITDFTANANLEVAIKNILDDKFDEASEIINKTIEEPKKMSSSTFRVFKKTKAYLTLLTCESSEAKKYYEETFTSDEISEIRNCKSYESIRLYVLYQGLVELAKSEIEFALQRKDKLDKRYEPGEVKKETELVAKALNKIYEINPGLKPKVEEKPVDTEQK